MSVITSEVVAAATAESSDTNRRQIGIWLLLCCVLVFAMVILGGVTRLTGSGLSMVDWEPVTGIIPPLDQAGWQKEFRAYQQSPEYQKINRGMSLEEFKRIYWFEFAHRILGRAIGIVFLIPFLYFWIRRKIDKPLVPKLITMFILGGLQGLLGWYMVKSGLVDDPHVSQYRLAAHLAAAVVIYGYMFWVALGLLSPQSGAVGRLRGLRMFAWLSTGLVFVTMVSGAFVAGLKAGFAYNTFPKMGDQWIPDGILMLQPVYLNFFENIATVQFDHRVLAVTVLAAIFLLWWRGRRAELTRRARLALYLTMGVAVAQVALGVATLLMHVPVTIAATHQGGAMLLFTAALALNHALRPSRRGASRE